MLGLFSCQIISAIATIVAREFPPKFEAEPSSDAPPGHLKPFGYQRPTDGPLVEEQGFLSPKVFWQKYVSVHKPMVFRQAVAESPALKKWTDEYLVAEYGDLDVLLEVKRENRSRQPKRLNISTFIGLYKKEDVYAVTVLPDPMRKEVQVPTCLLCGTFRDFVHETNFWMSSGGTRSVIHYDADENIHCIINGSKDFMMIEKSFQQYLPMIDKGFFSGSSYSSLDPDSVDLLLFPDVAKVQWTYATLYPGDCIYIPSEYLHQVRSYNRTISATILFTSTVDKRYEDKGCEDEDFQYTPLSDIDVHWTYKKGDRTIDMGYINIQVLKNNLLTVIDNVGELTVVEFSKYYTVVGNDELDPDSEDLKALFSTIFDVDVHGKVTKECIRKLSKEKLKQLARSLDDPHGPVATDDNDNIVSPPNHIEL